jgi:histone H1/5
MSDVAAAAPAKAQKAKKPRKPTKPADHPKYNVMIAAVAALKERGGSSRQAILKYIMANYKVGNEVTKINARLKTALKAGVKASTLKQAKGTGASGSFRLGEKVAKPKAAKPKKAKKPKAAKPKKIAKPKAAKPKKVVSQEGCCRQEA